MRSVKTGISCVEKYLNICIAHLDIVTKNVMRLETTLFSLLNVADDQVIFTTKLSKRVGRLYILYFSPCREQKMKIQTVKRKSSRNIIMNAQDPGTDCSVITMLKRVGSVSYTHLDVYKRQLQRSALK